MTLWGNSMGCCHAARELRNWIELGETGEHGRSREQEWRKEGYKVKGCKIKMLERWPDSRKWWRQFIMARPSFSSTISNPAITPGGNLEGCCLYLWVYFESKIGTVLTSTASHQTKLLGFYASHVSISSSNPTSI